ncbi:MAG: hypothetical protein KatS3mg072_1440 [Meiothermus sp.]|nr:MAG: hypothetical protein KatS3mg072_1440 [Meiothermus sp.]
MKGLRWSRWHLVGLTLILTACPFPSPAPATMYLFYFPDNPALCPQGIQAEVRVESGDREYLFRRLYFNPGNYRDHDEEEVAGDWEPRPGSEGTFVAVRFQMTRSATSPLRNETLSPPLPALEMWKGFYELKILPYDRRLPRLRVQCSDAPALEFVSQPGKLIFVILEDATVPSKLRVLQYATYEFGP